MNFKSITINDKEVFDMILQKNNYGTTELTFTYLFSWCPWFKTEYAIDDDTIFLRLRNRLGELYYLMPVGKMPLNEALNRLLRKSYDNNIPFQMRAITVRMWEKIEREVPGQFKFIRDRGDDEYIYLSEKLIHLSGAKLRRKRNHLKHFRTEYPNWEYTPLLSQSQIQECLEMLMQLEQKSSADASKLQQYDFISTRLILENYDILDLRGGLIRVDGKIVAFAIGEILTEDMFVVHIEKAFKDIQGAYTIINQQFVEHAASEFKYINREDDIGLENLRKAKMSYYPEMMLEKGIVRLK